MSNTQPGAETNRDSPAAHDQGLAAIRPVGRIRWWIHLVLIGGYFVPSIFLTRARSHPALTYDAHGLLVVCARQMALFGIAFGLAWWSSRATAEQMLLRWRPSWLVVPLGIGYSLGIRLAIALVALVVSVVLLVTVFDQAQLREFWRSGEPNIRQIVSVSTARSDPVYAWLLITVVSFVVAGLREELWRAGTLAGMRELWPGVFGSRTGEFAAITLIAIVFGAGHAQLGLTAAVFAGVLGIFLGTIMVVHRSIWPAAIAHGSFDALSFALVAWLPAQWQQF